MTRLEIDPDPTPTATPWEEYLAAAQSLDRLRREAATEDPASRAMRADLAGLWPRLERQRALLTGEVVRSRMVAPPLLPTHEEQIAATAAVAAGTLPVPEALRLARQLLDDCDTRLRDAATAGDGWWPPPRWLLVTAAGAAVTLLACAVLALVLLI